MKSVNHRETVTYWYDQMWNHRNPEPIDTLLDDHFVLHGYKGAQVTKQGFREFFDYFCGVFSEIKMDILDILEDGNQCAIRLSCQVTLASTEEKASFQMMAMVRFNDDGLAVEAWDTVDWFGYLTDLGALPQNALDMAIGEGKRFMAQ